MFKREAKFMLFLPLTLILIAVIGALVAPKLLRGACKNSIIEEISSPDKKNKIVIFTRDCGATTGHSTQVSLIAAGQKLQNTAGNLFIADTDHGKAPSGSTGGPIINASWESNDKILIEYHEQIRVFKAEEEASKIKIKYKRTNKAR
jgi:hypothetical protein